MRVVSVGFLIFVLGAGLAAGYFEPGPQASATTKKARAVTKKSQPGKPATAQGRTTMTTRVGTGSSSARKRPSTGKRMAGHPAVARQGAPTPDRYKEIQQALVSKGYLKTEPTGVWDADSAAAMRQFQTDRKLDPSGKLTAAALIDLGLGPKVEPHTPVSGAGEAVPEPPKIETAPNPEP